MDDAFDFVVIIDYREVGKAGFIEFVESKRAKDVFTVDEDHFGFGYHELSDGTFVKTHNGGDAVAVAI